MYGAVSQPTYTNLSYYAIQPPSDHNPPSTHLQSQPDPYTNYGPYPPPNYPTYQSQPSVYSHPNLISPAIQPLQNEAIASASYGTLMNMFNQIPEVRNRNVRKPKMISKKKSSSQSIWCNLCMIECNSVKHYEKHLSGKNHNKAIKKIHVTMISSSGQSSQSESNAGNTGPVVSSVRANLESKKQKLLECGTAVQSVKLCTICNVACNGEIAFSDHLVGKKHIAKERGLNISTKPSTISVSNPVTYTQKPAVVGPAYCDVCKISCTSSEGLVIHKQGKKHKRNLETLRNSISNINIAIPSSSSRPVVPVSTPPAARVGNLEPFVGSMPPPTDLESKKRKIVESGTDVNCVRTCDICNVVCNSETVLNAHLAGHKHMSLVKRVEAGGTTTATPTSNHLVTGSA